MTYPWEDLENEECMYRIMIVEDDEVIANAIRQHLVSWVCQVFCVSFNKIFWGGSPPHSYIAKLLKINSLKRSL